MSAGRGGLGTVSRLVWRGAAVLSLGIASAVAVDGHTARAATPLTVTPLWHQLLGTNTAIFQSSPNIATLDGEGPSVVVGSRFSGDVYAYHLVDGTPVAGWPQPTGYGVDGTPSVVPAGNGLDNVYVGAGSVVPPAPNVDDGAMYAFGPSGNTIWSRTLPDAFQPLPNPAVEASPAVGDTGFGTPAVVAGVIGLSLYSLDPGSGGTNFGWPQKTADTTFATAAIANINGHQKIIAASDSTGNEDGRTGALNNWDGGSVRLLDANGNTAWTIPNNEVVTSSPAVGNLDGAGPEVVFGHGNWWKQSDSTAVTGANAATGQVLWKTQLNGYTPASPALADLLGNGQLDVVEPTSTALNQPIGGDVYALRPDGSVLWGPVVLPSPPGSSGNPNTVYGGVATADFGEGYQDVVVASGYGWDILDGKTGAVVATQGLDINWDGNDGHMLMENTPLVTPDPTGNGLDVVVAGNYYSGFNGDITQGFIAAYRVSGPNNVGQGAWPQFHHDPSLTGSAIPPAPPPGTCIPNVPPCSSEGYWLAASDGGIFAFGNAPFHGSMGGTPLNKPVVGIAASADQGGYLMVASDGGVFAFGDAAFRGSMGGRPLNQPVVGMASAGQSGYRLVASDGGVFSFGPPFYGSMGGKPLDQPMVGIASDPATGGYWTVASDGGVFSFNAPFHGSMGGRPLNAPIVGMAATADGGGYWLVAADGGIFAFGDAPFYGSEGGQALSAPVVAVSSLANGAGYWEMASDGGVFSFGPSTYFRGSMGGRHLNAPIVGAASVG